MTAREGRVKAFISKAMLDELIEVIARPKFSEPTNPSQQDAGRSSK
jgi:hypothetical protein